jgi:peptide/nickel transport system substrate-binding protein
MKNPMFADKRVRKALAYALDYRELLDTICYGLYEQANGAAHPTAWYAPKKPLPYYHQDLDKAEALLDEAGWTDSDGDGIRDKVVDGKQVNFEFEIICPDIPIRVQSCTLLKESLDKIGIVCNVRPMEFTVLMEKTQKKEFQAFAGGWGAGSDPDTSANIFASGEQRNYVNYSNPTVDKLFRKGRKEFDRQKRAAIYAKIEELLYDDQPYTWLYYRNGFYGFNKDLRGFNFSPRGPYNFGPGFSAIWKPVE